MQPEGEHRRSDPLDHPGSCVSSSQTNRPHPICRRPLANSRSMLDCSNPAQAGPPFSVANSLKRRPLRLSPQIDEHHSQRDPPAAGGYLQPVRAFIAERRTRAALRAAGKMHARVGSSPIGRDPAFPDPHHGLRGSRRKGPTATAGMPGGSALTLLQDGRWPAIPSF